MESFPSLDRECSALAGLFQLTISDMKGCGPLWEEFIGRSMKMHSTLKGTLAAMCSFLDAFQRIADQATNTRGASTDVGATLTRLCLRHREVASRVRNLAAALLDTTIHPLQARLDDWKKTTLALDRDHTKEYKKARTELKKKTDMVTRLHKKAKKSNKPQTNKILSAGVEEVVAGYTALRDSERAAIRKVLLEERSRYCLLASSVAPVLREEVGMVGVLTQIQEVLQQLHKHTAEAGTLPPATEQVLQNIRDPTNSEVTWQTPPSSPSSLSGSHRSHRSSLTSLASSSTPPLPPPHQQQMGGSSALLNASPSHHGRSRSASQSGAFCGLVSGSSLDSGFTSRDTLHRHTISGPLARASLQASRVSDISNVSQPSSLSSNDGPTSLPPHPSTAHHPLPSSKELLTTTSTSTSSQPTNGQQQRNGGEVEASNLDSVSTWPAGMGTSASTWPNLPKQSANTQGIDGSGGGGDGGPGRSAIPHHDVGDRPHTISSSYEKSHVRERPALGPHTFTLPGPSVGCALPRPRTEVPDGSGSGGSSPLSGGVPAGGGGGGPSSQHTATISRRSSRSSLLHFHHNSASNSQESISSQCSTASGVRSKPPLPSRCSSLERPALPEKKHSSSFRQRLPLHHLLHHHHQSKNGSSDSGNGGGAEMTEAPLVPDFNQALPDMIVPQPVYSNMSELGGGDGTLGEMGEGEHSPHGSLTSSSGYGSQPSVRHHEDLPTLEECPAPLTPQFGTIRRHPHGTNVSSTSSQPQQQQQQQQEQQPGGTSLQSQSSLGVAPPSAAYDGSLYQQNSFPSFNSLGGCGGSTTNSVHDTIPEDIDNEDSNAPPEGAYNHTVSTAPYHRSHQVRMGGMMARRASTAPTTPTEGYYRGMGAGPRSSAEHVQFGGGGVMPHSYSDHQLQQYQYQQRQDRFSLPAPPTQLQQQLQLQKNQPHQQWQLSFYDQQQSCHAFQQGENIPRSQCPLPASSTAPAQLCSSGPPQFFPDGVAYQEGGDGVEAYQPGVVVLRKHVSEKGARTSSLRRSVGGKPPPPPIRRTASISTSSSSSLHTLPSNPTPDTSNGAAPSDHPQNYSYQGPHPLQHANSSSSLQHQPQSSSSPQHPSLTHALSSASLKHHPSGIPPPLSSSGLIHSSSSSSLPHHLASSELSHSSSSASLPPQQNSSSGSHGHLHFLQSSSASSLQNNFHSSVSSISLNNGGSSGGGGGVHDYSNSSSNNGSVMTLSGGDNNGGSIMTLSGDVPPSGQVYGDNRNNSDRGVPATRCNGDGAADSDDEGSTPRGSMENFPPPPDFLLEDDVQSKSSQQSADTYSHIKAPVNVHPPTSSGDQQPFNHQDAPFRPVNHTSSAPAGTVRPVISPNKPCASFPVSGGKSLSPEELSQEVARQLAPIYQSSNIQASSLNLCVSQGNNSSSQTSQNSSPSSLDQLSPLLDDDHPSPPSPCPPSPCPPGRSSMPILSPSSPGQHPSQEVVTSYSLFGPPEPIQDEGLSKRKVSVSEAVRNLQQSQNSAGSPAPDRKTSPDGAVNGSGKLFINGGSGSVASGQDDKAASAGSTSPANNTNTSSSCSSNSSSSDAVDAARASLISTLNVKISQQQQHQAQHLQQNKLTSSTSTTTCSNSQYDPYTQPLPMKLHQEDILQQMHHHQSLDSPNQNTNASLYHQQQSESQHPQLARHNSSPNANTQQQLLQLQQQHLEHLQHQQQQILHQQQLLQEQQLKQQQQSVLVPNQTLIAKPEAKAFLATLNTALSQRPSPPNKSQQLKNQTSATSATHKPHLKTQLSSQPSGTRTTATGSTPVKTSLRSSVSTPRLKTKRSIIMGTSTRASSHNSPSPGSNSSIPQPNGSSQTSSSSNSSRVSRSGSSSSDKFKFRQLISGGSRSSSSTNSHSSSSSSSPRESAVSSLATGRLRGSVSSSGGICGSTASNVNSSGGGSLRSGMIDGAAAVGPTVQLREGLLEQIRRGAKLRQTKQVADRSAPRVY